jgi:hypothetical protein
VIVPVALPLHKASVLLAVVEIGGPATTVTGINGVTHPKASVTKIV